MYIYNIISYRISNIVISTIIYTNVITYIFDISVHLAAIAYATVVAWESSHCLALIRQKHFWLQVLRKAAERWLGPPLIHPVRMNPDRYTTHYHRMINHYHSNGSSVFIEIYWVSHTTLAFIFVTVISVGWENKTGIVKLSHNSALRMTLAHKGSEKTRR